VILDTRPAERFASLHIRGAIQMGLEGPLASWAAILIKPEQRLVLVADSPQSVQEAHTRLNRVGLERVVGYVLSDEMEWNKEAIDLASISVHRCAAACRMLQDRQSFQLIDVRSRAEWLKGRLPGAISVPLLDLEVCAQSIDQSKPSLVYCNEGYRATTAASFLFRNGSTDLGILIDGIEGWSALGLPLELPEAR
jgi:rhodanese-related sulfurtransferase